MIRVLQVIGGLNRGGAETMIMNLYRAINRNVVQFDFVIHDEKQDAYWDEIISMGGKIFVFPQFKGINIHEYKRHWDAFLSEHPEYKILHSHVRSYASVFFPIAQKHGLKTIIHSHSTSNGSGVKAKVKKVFQIPLVRQSDYLFACSQISGEWLFGKKAIEQRNYYMIKNSIDVSKYRIRQEIRDRIREELGISNRAVYGHVGRLSEPKNHDFLLKVFQKIHEIEPNSVLLIVGSGELQEHISFLVKKMELSDCVKMLGSRSDVPQIMQAMDVFLFPSLWEGLPMTVVEAQAAGLPCLVSDKVTREVSISKAVKYLPIDCGTKCWINEAVAVKNNRYYDAADAVIQAGFDVCATAAWLKDFYLKVQNG